MKYVCDVCGWEYDEEKGYPEGGIAPGTKCAACFRIAPILLPIAILLLPFCLFFSELTCANIIIDK